MHLNTFRITFKGMTTQFLLRCSFKVESWHTALYMRQLVVWMLLCQWANALLLRAFLQNLLCYCKTFQGHCNQSTWLMDQLGMTSLAKVLKVKKRPPLSLKRTIQKLKKPTMFECYYTFPQCCLSFTFH
ncbi:hypothetical protein Hdeb2414_s0005g00183311 [Helianthus debilis subsp. tardiflorus]